MEKELSIYQKVDLLIAYVEYLGKENAALRAKVSELTDRLSKVFVQYPFTPFHDGYCGSVAQNPLHLVPTYRQAGFTPCSLFLLVILRACPDPSGRYSLSRFIGNERSPQNRT